MHLPPSSLRRTLPTLLTLYHTQPRHSLIHPSCIPQTLQPAPPGSQSVSDTHLCRVFLDGKCGKGRSMTAMHFHRLPPCALRFPPADLCARAEKRPRLGRKGVSAWPIYLQIEVPEIGICICPDLESLRISGSKMSTRDSSQGSSHPLWCTTLWSCRQTWEAVVIKSKMETVEE